MFKYSPGFFLIRSERLNGIFLEGLISLPFKLVSCSIDLLPPFREIPPSNCTGSSCSCTASVCSISTFLDVVGGSESISI